MLSAFVCTNLGTFHRFDFIGKVGVLDHVTEPASKVAVLEVEEPRLIIHAVRDLEENRQILGFEIEFPLGPAEVETLFRRKFAFRILAPVAPPFRAWLGGTKNERRLFRIAKPDYGFAGTE